MSLQTGSNMLIHISVAKLQVLQTAKLIQGTWEIYNTVWRFSGLRAETSSSKLASSVLLHQVNSCNLSHSGGYRVTRCQCRCHSVVWPAHGTRWLMWERRGCFLHLFSADIVCLCWRKLLHKGGWLDKRDVTPPESNEWSHTNGSSRLSHRIDVIVCETHP